MGSGLIIFGGFCVVQLLIGAGCRLHPSASSTGVPAGGGPREVHTRGVLVCLLEEMQKLHAVQVPPVHEHLSGVRAEDGRLYTLLKTSTSGFLFTDPRFRGRTLVLAGRTFPGTGLLEVNRADWLKEGKQYEVYYWCEVCSIKGVDPGPCACCQGPVELRERPAGGGPEAKVPAEPTLPAVKGEGERK